MSGRNQSGGPGSGAADAAAAANGAGPYCEGTLKAMQAAYGEGFLSPGGAEEVGDMVAGLELAGRDLLDFGSGLGGASLMLSLEFGAGSVVGLDVVPRSVEQARAAAKAAGVAHKVAFRLAETGPLPLDAGAVDLVFSKDVICHIPDKAPVFAELFRVLRPGGALACADFTLGGETGREHFEAWVAGMEATGLSFRFEPLQVYLDALEAAGFEAIAARDHTDWSVARCRKEIERAEGKERGAMLEMLGPEGLQARIALTHKRLRALESHGLCHVHLRARKPG